jgi:phosphoserine phosphatase RsbU/P
LATSDQTSGTKAFFQKGPINWTFQAILAGISVAMCAVLLLTTRNVNVFSVFLFTFITGNFTAGWLGVASPLFEAKGVPKWPVFLALLLPVSAIGSLLATGADYLINRPNPAEISTWFFSNLSLGILISLVAGISIFAATSAQLRLESERDLLQEQVLQGQAEVEARESEIKAAYEIQANLLPKTIPQIEGVQISCAWQPARTVSGDYFDVVPFSDERVGICLADVSGKGVSAALLMANLQAAFRAFATNTAQPGELCTKLNDVLFQNSGSSKFVTFFYGVIDRRAMTLDYENAGHVPPFLLRGSSLVELKDGNTVLGLFPSVRYNTYRIALQPSDVLILATDGVTEAANEQDEEFGLERIVEAASEKRTEGAHAIRLNVLDSVTRFCAGHFHDDASLMAVVLEPAR